MSTLSAQADSSPMSESRIRALRARAVDVPLPKPHPTAGGTLSSAPLALIDVTTDAGDVGRSYLFTYTTLALRSVVALLQDLEPVLVDLPAAPKAISETLGRCFGLLGAQGIVQMAIGGIDMALWDALAVAAQVPLHRLLGGAARPLEAYSSLGMMMPDEAAREAYEAVSAGFRAVKFKIGGTDAAADRELVHAVRRAVGADVGIMVDYNQSLTAAEAVRRGRSLEEFNLTWLEEPCRMDDDASHAVVAATLDVPVLFGENWWSPAQTARAIATRALDEIMLDVMKIGGVSGWLTAAGMASCAGMCVSSHLFTEFSAQLIAASPSGRYVEWLDLASPVLEEPLAPSSGMINLGTRSGAGLGWNEDAVERFSF
jgi:mandelate racemase